MLLHVPLIRRLTTKSGTCRSTSLRIKPCCNVRGRILSQIRCQSANLNRVMSGFFEEIKRRKVYRVAVAYAVGAGGAIQLASAVFPAWDLPSWALRLVIIVLLIGFPLSLILSWALEVTPEGIRATPSAPAAPRRRRNIVALVGVGIIVSAAAGFFLLLRVSARKVDYAIAVVRF